MKVKTLEKLAKDMIDYIINLSGFEHIEDIQLNVVDNLESGGMAECNYNDSHGYIQLNIASNMINDIEQAKYVISHELGHILTREFHTYYVNFVGLDDDDMTSICSNVYEQTAEILAKRLGRLILKLYEQKDK